MVDLSKLLDFALGLLEVVGGVAVMGVVALLALAGLCGLCDELADRWNRRKDGP